MIRKEALFTETLTHFAVDLTCFFLLAGPFARTVATTSAVSVGYLIFFLLSFGLRPFLGLMTDEFPRMHSQAIGCLLVGVSCLFPPSWAWISLLPAAVGSALFHTGAGGESLAFARGYFLRSGTIFSTGVFGAALGTALAQTSTPLWIGSIVMTVLSFGCFLFAEARKYPRRIRSFRNGVIRTLPPYWILLFTLFPVLSASLTGALLPKTSLEEGWGVVCALSCMLGRFAGGFAADRFGPRKTSVVSFALALPLLTVFTHVPWVYCLGLGVLSAPFSVCLGTATAALPTRPHFVFGLCSVGILLGTGPGFFIQTATDTARLVSALLLILSALLAAFLYTDHCKMFVIPRRRPHAEKRKEKRRENS